LIAKWKEWVLRIEDFESRDHKILIHEGEGINKSGAVSIFRNILIDARELIILKATNREKQIIKKCLESIPTSPIHEKRWRPQYWEITIKKSWPLDLADSLIFSCDKGEVIGFKSDKVFVKSRERPNHITTTLQIKGEIWRIPLPIIKYRWIEPHEIPRKKRKKRREVFSSGK